jgi:histone-lysine N-methyltransferase SETD1
MTQTYNEKKATSRILEGEVVSLGGNYERQLQQQHRCRRKRQACGTTVELLIDQDRLEDLPFLKRIDPVIDLSKLSEAARRGHVNEERIRGKNKVMVQVVLTDSCGIVMSENNRKVLEARWVIRKRVPAKLPNPVVPTMTATDNSKKQNGKLAEGTTKTNTEIGETNNGDSNQSNGAENNGDTTNTDEKEKPPNFETTKKRRKSNGMKDPSAARYVGDGNDSAATQENNWRWQARRYNNLSLLMERPISLDYLEYLSYGFVGEVIKVTPAPASSNTLALVTVKRLLLPEHTESGRLSHHDPCDMYDDQDYTRGAYDTSVVGSDGEKAVYYCIPVEELVIVSRRVERHVYSHSVPKLSPEKAESEFNITSSYSLLTNRYAPLRNPNDFLAEGEVKHPRLCHRCRRVVYRSKQGDGSQMCCKSCLRELKQQIKRFQSDNQTEARDICDCRECLASVQSDRLVDLNVEVVKARVADDSGDNLFLSTRMMLQSMEPVDFDLTPDFLPRYAPSGKPIVKVKQKTIRKLNRKNSMERPNDTPMKSPTRGKIKKGTNVDTTATANAEKEAMIFKPTSARLFTYDAVKRKFDASPHDLFPWAGIVPSKDKPLNLRELKQELTGESEKDEKTTVSRAARVNQRRLMRDVTAIGMSFDTLSGREQALRFDRSGIHAWGVFADEDMREGDMLIEYRGEIIGNTMAEKREKEYEDAKIGSDYMFRIDELTVCDATKQGNVARFINASCDPNCYTKIISIYGTNRICIYAKRDIREGEELCYDYKFPLEYDESKRIPCHCGSKGCRGFMNWVSLLSFLYSSIPAFFLTFSFLTQDKKYVAVTTTTTPEGSPSNLRQASDTTAGGACNKRSRENMDAPEDRNQPGPKRLKQAALER